MWYEEQRKGLGSEFMRSVEVVLESIRRSPETYPKIHEEVHRVLVKRFPYGVYYLIEEAAVVIVAVFHMRRNPIKLRKRQ